ncbi:MAG: SpoIIE family protein phosphatase, partial [Bacteroidota bacterium]
GLGFFTAADCTGHGVPGAFMSMIGTSLLNEVVNEKGIVKPNAILFEVRKGIITSLKQTGEEGQQKDGMDMALCAIDKANMLLHYAGANNSLYVIRASETPLTDANGATVEVNQERNGARLFEVKATKQPVGYYTGNMAPYDLHTFHLQPGDVLYTFSDGYADQFGGPKGKKFKYLPFKRLLLDNYQQPMENQRELLDQTIMDWMGEHEQIDDICIIGVRI